MTKHNIKEHLDWLIKCTSFQPPQPVYAPPSTGLDSALKPFPDSQSPPQRLDNLETATLDAVDSPEKVDGPHPPPEFAKPLLPASKLTSQNNDAMARLQSGTKTSHKPRLLSESLPLSLQTPSTSSSNVPRTSLKDRYNAQWERKAPASAPPAQRKDRGDTQANTPPVSALKSRYTFEDSAALDLTGDGMHTSSSSIVEAFGESRPIWREDSATRKEPLPTKGKKRKSDEFEEDELQANIPLRLSQDSFTAIDLFEDDVTPQKKSMSPKKPKRLSTNQRTTTHLAATDHFFDDDLNSPSTLGKRQAKQGPEALSAPPATPVEEASQPSCGKRDPGGKKSASQASDLKAVADSEDEDEETVDPAQYRSLKQEIDEKLSPNYAALAPEIKKQIQPLKSEEIVDVDLIRNNKFSPAKAIHLLQTNSGASPYQRDSPTKFPANKQLSRSPQVPNSSKSSQKTYETADTESVQAFLSFQTSRIQAFLDGLYCTRRSIAEAVYNRTVEGRTDVQEMQQQAQSLTARIDAIGTLLALREEHMDLVKRKETIKARILAAIHDDVVGTHHANDYAEREQIFHRLAEIETEISQLLAKASLPPSSSLPSTDINHQSKVSSKNVSKDHPTTLVQSTQVYPQIRSRTIPDGRLPISSDSGSTQFVQQTQAPNKPVCPPVKEYLGQDARAQRIPLRTYTSSPAAKDANVYFSPSKASKSRESSAKLQERTPCKPTHHKADLKNYQEHPILESNEEDEDIYMNHMGSPYHSSRDDDEYGRDDDDVDMLEVAEELENRNAQPFFHQGNPQREIFGETSGNAGRAESSKLEPTFAPAFAHTHHQPSQMQYPWSNDVKVALNYRFHLRGFRPNQLEAINATLSGKDAFVLMPTGGGKSLCYQLPSIVDSGKTRGVTVVISPLLSLMQDQVEHLQKLKIQALLVNGEVTTEHRRLVLNSLKGPQPQRFCQLLYITPEMINKNQTMVSVLQGLHKRDKLARIVIDEAHCVSQWGHDFRPDYKLLGEVRQQFHGVPVIALTATATENVKVDVIHNLGIQNCEVFTQSFNRPNLTYEVRAKGKGIDVLDSMAKTINTSYRRQSGIIYCLSKKNCEDVAKKLKEHYKIAAHHYHAGMEPEEKKRVQKAWQVGEYHVIVATIAFGMGIDKPDVRFVIHHTIPKSLEGYYQETGRAGRDGKWSGCFMYYGYQDTSTIKRMIDDGDGSWDQKERQRQMLRKVLQFCENKSDCRRVQVLGYFNEFFNKEDCRGSCDNCNSKSTFETQDFTDYGAIALNLVRKVQAEKVTLLHCVDVFRGAKTKKITTLQHDEIPEYGAGSDIDRGNVERLFYRLLSEDAIMEKNVVNKLGFAHQYVHLGKNSHDFSKGRRRLKIQIRLSPTGKPKAKPTRKGPETGVAASAPDYPASTNISSPVLPAASRRRVQRAHTSTLGPDLRKGGHSRDDDFVVDEDEDGAMVETEDDSEESFEPVRVKGKTRSVAKKTLGPPITTDEKIQGLSRIHQYVVEGFLTAAKQQSQNLLMSRNLRAHPFTDTMLREMAINFPQSEEELLQIPNIDPDKVQRYGRIFLKLVKDAHQGYEAMMQQEDRPRDPNHQTITIDISSDDEHGDGGDLDEFDADEESLGEPSRYFPADDVQAFNAQLTQLGPAIPPVRTQSSSNEPKSRGSGRGGRGAFRGRSSFKRGGRKASGGGSGKSKTAGNTTKRQSNSSRTSGSSFGNGQSKRGGAGGGVGGRGIGMMPI